VKPQETAGALAIVVALGSLIYAATSFADHAGNRRFHSSWIV
jgi:hypothetical protein